MSDKAFSILMSNMGFTGIRLNFFFPFSVKTYMIQNT